LACGQAFVSVTLRALSGVPSHGTTLGVQRSLVAGCVEGAQLLSLTSVPSERRQRTSCVRWPESISAVHVSVRVCAVRPHPFSGAQSLAIQRAVPPLHAPNPPATHEYVQPEKTPAVSLAAGLEGGQLASATNTPSARRHLTWRVRSAASEHWELQLLHALVCHEYVQVSVSTVDWLNAPCVPHENPLVGVHDWLAAGLVPVQNVSATVVPSERRQVTLRA
jgi:hypothetical protein